MSLADTLLPVSMPCRRTCRTHSAAYILHVRVKRLFVDVFDVPRYPLIVVCSKGSLALMILVSFICSCRNNN
jgi:hypothetical protein